MVYALTDILSISILKKKICAKSMAESSKKTRTEEPPPPSPPTPKRLFNFIFRGKPIKNFYELKTPTTPEEQEATYWVFTRSFPDGTRKPQGKVPPPLRARILAKGGSDVQLRAVNDKKHGNNTVILQNYEFIRADPIYEVTTTAGLEHLADEVNKYSGVVRGFSRKKRNKKRKNKDTKRYRR
jgi:hypothetical protein